MTTNTDVLPSGTWKIDPRHSTVGFSVKHMGIATVRGDFTKFEGWLRIGEDLATSKAEGTVEVASVSTNEPERDDHLRSSDFFDAEGFPELRFESTAFEGVDEETFRVCGRLTIHGVTNDIALRAQVHGTETDIWGNERVGIEVTGQLSRGDYGMKFNQTLGTGNLLVGDKVKLVLDISALRQSS